VGSESAILPTGEIFICRSGFYPACISRNQHRKCLNFCVSLLCRYLAWKLGKVVIYVPFLRDMRFRYFKVTDFYFFSKPDLCVVRTKMTTKRFKLFPQTPTMVVWNHMNERMIPVAFLWRYSAL